MTFQQSWLMAVATAAVGVFVACGTEEEAAKEDPNAAFNYVPLNINVCQVGDQTYKRRTISRALAAIGRGDSVVAENLRLCADCPDNKFGLMLKETKAKIYVGGKALADSHLDRVNKALAYPFRHLILSSGIKVGNTQIVLGQAIKIGADSAAMYELQPETLAPPCHAANLTTSGSRTDLPGACGDLFKTKTPFSKPFGFKVPNALPPATATQAEAAALLEQTAALGIQVNKAEVAYQVNDNGTGEGTLSGWIAANSLKPFLAAGVDVAKYGEGTPVMIRVVFKFDTRRVSLSSAIDHDVASMTTVMGQPVAKPPAISTGSVTWPGGSCTGCKSVGTQSVCADEQTAEVPLAAVHIQGDSGSFKVKVDAAGRWPVIDSSAVESGGTVATDGDSKLNEVQITFTRGYRAGSGQIVKPACADVMTGKVAAPTTFDPKDGWIRVAFRSSDGVEVGCQHSILVCQEFDDSSCGANGKLNADGTCGCQDGFQFAFDACVKAADYGCDPAALLAKDSAGAVTCTCPTHMAGDGKKCATDPCKDNGPCKVGEYCIVQGDHTAGCEPVGTETLGAGLARRSEVVAAYEDAAPTPAAAPGTGEKAGALEDDDDDEDHSAVGDIDAGKTAASPPGAPGADFIAKYSQRAKRSVTVARQLTLFGKTGPISLAEDLTRTVDGKKISGGAIVTRGSSRKSGSGFLAMQLSAQNWATMMTHVKGNNLTPAFRVATSRVSQTQGAWFPAQETTPHTSSIASYKLAECPELAKLLGNKTELVYEFTVSSKPRPAPKFATPAPKRTLKALAAGRTKAKNW